MCVTRYTVFALWRYRVLCVVCVAVLFIRGVLRGGCIEGGGVLPHAEIDAIAKVVFQANNLSPKRRHDTPEQHGASMLEEQRELAAESADLMRRHQVVVPQQIGVDGEREACAVTASNRAAAKKRTIKYATEPGGMARPYGQSHSNKEVAEDAEVAVSAISPCVGGMVAATDSVAHALAIMCDSGAPEPTHPAYALYIRKVGTAGSIVLYLLLCSIASAVGCDAEVLPGGLKGLRRIVFKSCLNYGCDFSMCKDGIRATIILQTLAGVLQMLLALLRADDIVVVRMKNRFGQEHMTRSYSRDFDANPLGGYRDLQLLCLFRLGGQWRYGEVQLNLQQMVAIKEQADGGHRVFKFCRSIRAFAKAVYSYSGTVSEALIRQVGAGMVLSIFLVKATPSIAGTDSVTDAGAAAGAADASKALLRRLFAAMGTQASRIRSIGGLSNAGIEDADCESLGAGIAGNSSLAEMWLNKNEIGDAGCEHLGSGIAASTSLTTLRLESNGIGNLGCRHLGAGIAASTSLTKVSLRDNAFGDDGCEHLGAGMAKSASLVEIDLSTAWPHAAECGNPIGVPPTRNDQPHNFIGDAGCEHLGAGIAASKSLVKMNLRDNRVGDEGGRLLGGGIAGSTTLVEIDLHGNRIGQGGGEGLGIGIAKSASLKSIELSGNRIDDIGGKGLGAGIAKNASLEDVWLSDNQIGDIGGGELGKGIGSSPSLTRVDLARNIIGDAGCEHLGAGIGLSTSLVRIRLGDNRIGDNGCEHLGRGIGLSTSLVEIDLGENQIGDNSCKHLATGIAASTSLVGIRLGRNQIGDEGCEHLGTGIAGSTSLSMMDLSQNQIGDKGCEHLATGIAVSTSLAKIDLSRNQIGDQGCEYVGIGVAASTSLANIDLSDNLIGNAGYGHIGAAVAVSKAPLEGIKLDICEHVQVISEEVKDKFEEICKSKDFRPSTSNYGSCTTCRERSCAS